MSCERTVVIVMNVDGGDRTALEHIENDTFNTEEDVRKHLEAEEGVDPTHVHIFELTDFMDAWNDSDCDNVEGSFAIHTIATTVIGYVTLRN